MARGKHAAASAVRRADAAHEHIDRLTDQLVDAKARARRHEAAAARLPSVEAELARLRAQIAAGTSDALESERAAWQAKVDDLIATLAEVKAILRGAIDRYEDQHGKSASFLSVQNLHDLDRLWGSMVPGDEPRRVRRAKLTSPRDLLLNSDLDGTGFRRVGERFRRVDVGETA